MSVEEILSNLPWILQARRIVVGDVIPANTSRQELDEYRARMGARMGRQPWSREFFDAACNDFNLAGGKFQKYSKAKRILRQNRRAFATILRSHLRPTSRMHLLRTRIAWTNLIIRPARERMARARASLARSVHKFFQSAVAFQQCHNNGGNGIFIDIFTLRQFSALEAVHRLFPFQSTVVLCCSRLHAPFIQMRATEMHMPIFCHIFNQR